MSTDADEEVVIVLEKESSSDADNNNRGANDADRPQPDSTSTELLSEGLSNVVITKDSVNNENEGDGSLTPLTEGLSDDATTGSSDLIEEFNSSTNIQNYTLNFVQGSDNTCTVNIFGWDHRAEADRLDYQTSSELLPEECSDKKRLLRHGEFLEQRLEYFYGLNDNIAEIFTFEEMSRLDALRNDSSQTNKEILKLLCKKEEAACTTFIIGLGDSFQSHLKRHILQNGEFDIHEQDRPLTKTQVTYLIRDRKTIVPNLQRYIDPIAQELFKSQCISEDHQQVMTHVMLTNRDKARLMMTIMANRSLQHFMSFRQILSTRSDLLYRCTDIGTPPYIASVDTVNEQIGDNTGQASANFNATQRKLLEADVAENFSADEASASDEKNIQNIIGLKPGQSIRVYFNCPTVEELERLRIAVENGSMMQSLDKLYNDLLAKNEKRESRLKVKKVVLVDWKIPEFYLKCDTESIDTSDAMLNHALLRNGKTEMATLFKNGERRIEKQEILLKSYFWSISKSSQAWTKPQKLEILKKLSNVCVDWWKICSSEHFTRAVKAKAFPSDSTVPDCPSAPLVSDVTKNSCVLSWTSTKHKTNDESLTYVVQYKTLDAEWWMSALETFECTAKIERLVEGSVYEFRVKAMNTEGVSQPGPKSRAVLITDTKPLDDAEDYDFVDDSSELIPSRERGVHSASRTPAAGSSVSSARRDIPIITTVEDHSGGLRNRFRPALNRASAWREDSTPPSEDEVSFRGEPRSRGEPGSRGGERDGNGDGRDESTRDEFSRTQRITGSRRSASSNPVNIQPDFDDVSELGDRDQFYSGELLVPDAVLLEELDSIGSSKKRKRFLKSHGIVKSDPGTKSQKKLQLYTRSVSNSRIDPRTIWDRLNETIDDGPVELKPERRRGWKNVRIFVSSTFTDFHNERELLVKTIFPELKNWCEERRLRLMDVDLRWGIPEEMSEENRDLTVKICLREIDRCYEENVMPYFLNMTSERIGWIPDEESVTEELLEQYKLMLGLSVTEMEIVHAAYRNDNPNAIFLIRDSSFVADLDEFSERASKALIDKYPLAEEKLEFLKTNIKQRFAGRAYTYQCKYVKDKDDPDPKRPKLRIDPKFTEYILEFFKGRIRLQYPLLEENEQKDQWLIMNDQQEAFMKSKIDIVYGRDGILKQIHDYIYELVDEQDHPRFLIGRAGMGKTTVMCVAANEVAERSRKEKSKGRRGSDGQSQPNWKVFYHFVGAVPQSTSLRQILRRFLIHFQLCEESALPQSSNDLRNIVKSALLDSRKLGHVVIIIDAIDQIDSSDKDYILSWLPHRPLPENVRVVVSFLINSPPYNLVTSENNQIPHQQIQLDVLREDARIDIVKKYLWQYRKILSTDQMEALMKKISSRNPLWLIIACEELRIFGDMRKLDEHLASLKDSLRGLLDQVLDRLSREGNKQLLKATLCLLEVSKCGLLENELLTILSNVGEYNPHSIDSEMNANEFKPKVLPYQKWAAVYYALRPFLRPYGAKGDGRITFYHKELSRVVRRKYLGEGSTAPQRPDVVIDDDDEFYDAIDEMSGLTEHYHRWHSTLADYFERVETKNDQDEERKIEEYPYHLIKLNDFCRLRKFLMEWKVFDKLFDSSYSDELLRYWRQCGSYSSMVKFYSEKIKAEERRATSNAEKLELFRRCDELSLLFEQAGHNSESAEFANKALRILEPLKCDDKESKQLKIYGHLGRTEINRLTPTKVIKSEITIIEEAIKYYDEAIAMMQRHPERDGRNLKRYMALQLRNKAYALGCIADRCDGGFPGLSSLFGSRKQNALKEGRELVKQSLKLYKEVNDHEQVLSTQMTEATLYHDEPNKQHQHGFLELNFSGEPSELPEAWDEVDAASQRSAGYEQAYQQCMEAFTIGKEVFGQDHELCKAYIEMLNDRRYRDIKARRQSNTSASRR